MKLGDWFKEERRYHNWLADKMGVTHVTVSNWIRGKSKPTRIKCKLIEMHTNGKVTATDFGYAAEGEKKENSPTT